MEMRKSLLVNCLLSDKNLCLIERKRTNRQKKQSKSEKKI